MSAAQELWKPAPPPRTETLIGYPGKPQNYERAKELGVNSIAVHVSWRDCEPRADAWSFDAVDARVQDILEHGLLWVPQLVFTSSVPDWFVAKGLSVRQRCVEHGRENGPESIFNPHLRPYLRRFYEAVRDHFGERLDQAYEIELHTCQYGEPNYFFIDRTGPVVPGWGGALHHGFQCGDELACADFRRAMAERYASIDALNRVWGTCIESFDDVSFLVPPEEAADLKDDFGAAFDDVTNTYRFDPHLTARLALGRRWVDQVGWYRDAMNGYFEHVVRTARDVFGDRRLVARLGGCSYLPWLGSGAAWNVRVAAKHGAEVRFTGAVHTYDQKVLSTATRFYRTGLWTEPMYALGRQTGPTMMRARRWFDAVFFGASCGQNLTRSEYTNSFFERDGMVLEHNFPIYEAAVEATAVGQPFVRFATLLPTTQTCFGFDHRYFMGKLDVLLDFTDADVLDETLLAEGALDRYDALLVRMGGLVEPRALSALEAYAHAGGVVCVGPRGLLTTLENPRAGWPLMGLRPAQALEAGGEAQVPPDSPWLTRLASRGNVPAEAAVPADVVDGEVLARTADGRAVIWLRPVGRGGVLVCLCDDDDVLIPAFLSVAERFGRFQVDDGRRDDVLMTRLGEQVLVFNRNDQPVEVPINGRTVAVPAYDESSVPLEQVTAGRAGPRIESVEFEALEGFHEVYVRTGGGPTGGGYLEVRRPDYRTIYVDLTLRDSVLAGVVPTDLLGEYLLTVYVLDPKQRPTSMRRLAARIG